METEALKPLKVCRHCSVASRTDAATCPSCGRPYERQLWQWRWWLAIPIVAVAFAGGYFGISRLIDDDNPEGITVEEANAIQLGITRSDLVDQLGGEQPQYTLERGEGPTAASCFYYAVAETPDTVWEFCFTDDELAKSTAIG